MLSPFVRCMLLRVVGSCCAKFETAVKLLASCKRTQQLPTMLGVVGQQFCVRFHGAKSLYLSFLVDTVLLNSFVSAFLQFNLSICPRIKLYPFLPVGHIMYKFIDQSNTEWISIHWVLAETHKGLKTPYEFLVWGNKSCILILLIQS